MVSKEDIIVTLDEIPDPELGISVWQLGLIYDIVLDEAKGLVTIIMTLTSMGCPLFDQIAHPMEAKIKELEGVKNVKVDLTFEPPWNPEKMSDEAKMQLGML